MSLNTVRIRSVWPNYINLSGILSHLTLSYTRPNNSFLLKKCNLKKIKISWHNLCAKSIWVMTGDLVFNCAIISNDYQPHSRDPLTHNALQ